jgi:histidyl-tRNA synthetase
MGDKAKSAAVKFASELRRSGLLVHLSLGGKSIKAQMRQANALGVEYAFIFGEDEVRNGTVTYRDMETGEQWEVALEDVVDLLTEV